MQVFMTALATVLLSSSLAHAKLEVVATIPDLAAITQEVGGELVKVAALSSANQDPHYVDPRPSFVIALNRADLLVINGMDLEIGWLPKLQVQARNPKVSVGGAGFVNASRFITPLDVPTTKPDRALGDVHAGGNPHYLYDPRAAAKVAIGLAQKLSELDGANAATYQSRAADFARRMESFAAAQAQLFSALPVERRQVVSYHRSLPYMLEWLGLTEVAEVEPKPGIPPNPSHVASVLDIMRRTGAKVIVQEAHHPTSTTETLAQLAGARLVRIAGGTEIDAAQTYMAHIDRMTTAIYEAVAK